MNPVSTAGPSAQYSTTSSAPTSSSAAASTAAEDRLGITWRTIASAVVLMSQKSEKLAFYEGRTDVDENAKRVTAKELDEAIISFLRNRQDWLRIVSHLESKLEGKAKENEVLHHYYTSMPQLYAKKRKREIEADVAAPHANDAKTDPSSS
jgi:hypothetical protein